VSALSRNRPGSPVDMPLAELVMQRELSALAHPTPASQRQLVETLEALLDSGGVATEAAAQLNVHPPDCAVPDPEARAAPGQPLHRPQGAVRPGTSGAVEAAV